MKMTGEENSENISYPENSNSDSNYPSSSHEDSEVDHDETDSKVNFAAKKIPVRVSSKLNIMISKFNFHLFCFVCDTSCIQN